MIAWLSTNSHTLARILQKRRQFKSLSKSRFLLITSVDILLGCVLTYCLSTTTVDEQARWIYARLFQLSDALEDVIKWLSDNPAGLKLNAPLNATLSRFFAYHVHLWRTYISFMQPLLPNTVLVCRLTCILGGVTLQMCLLRDIISLLTIHIFCFYIYAQRLFQFQSIALRELWRLFRGKKYNPFRQRVDYAEFDTEQLFLGTLLFTFLLFLLPTTLVYFVVMSGLRYAVVSTTHYLLRTAVTVVDVILGRLFNNDSEAKSHVE